MRRWVGLVLLGLLGGAVAVVAVPGRTLADGADPFVAKIEVGAPGAGGTSCTGSLVDRQWLIEGEQITVEVDPDGSTQVGLGADPEASPTMLLRLTVTG